MQRIIEESAYRQAQRIESGAAVVIGVNRFTDADDVTIPALAVDPALEQEQVARLAAWRHKRGPQGRGVGARHSAYHRCERCEPASPDEGCVARRCNGGEVSGAIGDVFGRYRRFMSDDLGLRFLVIGGGPGGIAAATAAAIHGAQVTVVESTILGGAAHLLDCIPSKALVASSMRLDSLREASQLGLDDVAMPVVYMDGLSARADAISARLSQGVGNSSSPRVWRSSPAAAF